MLATSANLPDSVVGFLPVVLDEFSELKLQTPRFFTGVDALVAPVFLGIHHLAVHVELELVGRRVANSNRR